MNALKNKRQAANLRLGNEYTGTPKTNKSEAVEIHPAEYWHENYFLLLRKTTADEKEQKNWIPRDFVYSCRGV